MVSFHVGSGMLGAIGCTLHASTRSSLRLPSLSRAALVSSVSLLNSNVLGMCLPECAAAKLTQTDKQTSMLSSLLAAGAFAAVLLPMCEPADCMGKKRKKDSVLDDDMYVVDHIKARRLVKGQPEYLIKWKGFDDDKYDTWEGLANLSGLEPDVAVFEARQKKEQIEFAKQMAARKESRKAASGKGGTGSSAAGSSVAGLAAATGEAAGEEPADEEAVEVQEEGGSSSRKKAAIWARWKETSVNGEYECQEPKAGGGICGDKLHPCGGPTSLWNHHRGKHKDTYMELKGFLSDEAAAALDVGVSPFDATQATIQAQPFAEARKKECDMACARWLVKSARPITLPECDKPFGNFIHTLTRGAWHPPNRRNVMDCILQLSATGQLRFRNWNEAMVASGVKPSMAGDIWSHGGCSLMGICFYGISRPQWKMDEWLVAATPFGSTRHTGEAIDSITVAALQKQGVKWREGGSVYEAVHSKVSDNASNMAKGWAGFDGGFCVDHTLELSVKFFTGAAGIKETFARDKGIVAYFHRSTAGIQDLTTIQKSLKLPEKQPIQDVATRWFSSYGMVDWFREQQQAVQMYDVQHGAEAAKNDAYKDHRLQHQDWAINEQSVAVLAPSAQATKLLEGTKYVTISLVLPYIYRLIEASADGMLYLPWKPAGQQWLRADQMEPKVRAARKLFHANLKRRWLDELPTAQRTELDICTLLDPRFKEYNFPGLPPLLDLSDEKDAALEALKGTWEHNWKPAAAPALTSPASPAPAAARIVTTATATAAAKMGASSSFFAMPMAPQPTLAPHPAVPAAVVDMDDLEKYAALPAEANLDLDVLKWWKARDHDKPADPASGRPAGLPHLAKMAAQFLGRPASSAGVERMFSKAGKLHDDMKKGQEDDTLEHSLFAAANTE
jgi:hypothetical protein